MKRICPLSFNTSGFTKKALAVDLGVPVALDVCPVTVLPDPWANVPYPVLLFCV